MDFINGFFSNLSSKYTSTLIAFMTGVVFAKFRWHKGPGLALLIGVYPRFKKTPSILLLTKRGISK